jgi:branched-chain amino acid transport system permease protein
VDAAVLQILNGLDKGSAYALIALGLTLIFGTLGVVNFAHGALFMIGAFCAVTFSRLLGWSYTVIDDTKRISWETRPKLKYLMFMIFLGNKLEMC